VLASLGKMRRSLLLMLALVLTLPATATASGEDVVRDCTINGRLTHTYSLAELRNAPRHLDTSDREYSNCTGVIADAIRAASVRPITKKTGPGRHLGSPGAAGPTSGGGGTPSSPTSPGSVPDAGSIPPVSGGPSRRHPSVLRSAGEGAGPASPAGPAAHASRTSSGLDALPTPLLVLLVALLLAAVAGVGLSLRRRLGGDRRWSDVLRRGA